MTIVKNVGFGYAVQTFNSGLVEGIFFLNIICLYWKRKAGINGEENILSKSLEKFWVWKFFIASVE